MAESRGRLNQRKRRNCTVASGGREIETDGEDRIAMVMQDGPPRWSSAVRERVEGGRAALQCGLLVTMLPGVYL